MHGFSRIGSGNAFTAKDAKGAEKKAKKLYRRFVRMDADCKNYQRGINLTTDDTDDTDFHRGDVAVLRLYVRVLGIASGMVGVLGAV